VKAGAAGEGQDGGIHDEDVGAASEGKEIAVNGSDAQEHEKFGAGEGENAEPAVEGKEAALAGAEVAEGERANGERGNSYPEKYRVHEYSGEHGHYSAMVPQKEGIRGLGEDNIVILCRPRQAKR